MAYEISVGPAQLTINLGEFVLITETDGQIRQPSERGLFYRDTRLISNWTITVNGQSWTGLSAAATVHFAAQAVMTNPDLPTDGETVPAGTVSLTLSRLVGLTGMRETLALRNHNRVAVRLTVAIRIACDFADIFDVKSHQVISRGRSETRLSSDGAHVETVHCNGTFRRGISVGSTGIGQELAMHDGALCFVVALEPQATWSTELLYQVIEGNELLSAPGCSFAEQESSPQADALKDWRQQATRLRSSHAGVEALYEHSVDDLIALRLPIEGTDLKSFIPAAGIPWFAGLFGRDSILTAILAVSVYPDFARGALEVLARYQADSIDDSRDMQPGKIPHELRRGELAELGLVPSRPYYGSADSTPLYIVLLHQAWRFTGDDSLIEAHLATAERCLAWIDDFGDLDGDGFQEYQSRTPAGAENQGWKDSGNAILYDNGDNVPSPKTLCELQGYVYDAWRRMAVIYKALGKAEASQRLSEKADKLYQRFNEVFWDEAQQAYALCLDPDKRRVMSVSSNPGHLLWSAIVPRERAGLVAQRLMADDMWSGWGVRTLSSSHPAYNPHDYQLGAIWPHDNGLIALGLKQYGFHAEAARIVGGLVEAGNRFLLHRLPEVFAGTSRSDSPFPIQYLGANVPQAWAAAAIFGLVRALLGIETDPATGTIYADPHLPDWLPEFRLDGMRVGRRMAGIRVWHDGAETNIELTSGEGIHLVRRSMSDVLAV